MKELVTIFGGTGFLGRRIASRLVDHRFCVRIAARRAPRERGRFGGQASAVEFVMADIADERSVVAALSGSRAVVNAVSLYVEHGARTFRSVHVEAAARVASQARAAGVARLVHISGVGADEASRSAYIRSRGQGEAAVRQAFPAATIIRPAVMFAEDDSFLRPIARLLRSLPAFPLFGRGRTLLQPAHVDDVAEAVARIIESGEPAELYELGGPAVYRYEHLVRMVGEQIGSSPILVPVPFGLWRALAWAAEFLPAPPVTRNQVELMQIDNTASGQWPGFSALGIEPRSIEEVLAKLGRPARHQARTDRA